MHRPHGSGQLLADLPPSPTSPASVEAQPRIQGPGTGGGGIPGVSAGCTTTWQGRGDASARERDSDLLGMARQADENQEAIVAMEEEVRRLLLVPKGPQ